MWELCIIQVQNHVDIRYGCQKDHNWHSCNLHFLFLFVQSFENEILESTPKEKEDAFGFVFQGQECELIFDTQLQFQRQFDGF